MTPMLQHHLKQLKLPVFLRDYHSMAQQCQTDRADYPTYLLRLAERELIEREQRASERRIKAAKFPVVKTLDTFEFQAQPSINETLVWELLRGEYMDNRERAKRIWLQHWDLLPACKARRCASIPLWNW